MRTIQITDNDHEQLMKIYELYQSRIEKRTGARIPPGWDPAVSGMHYALGALAVYDEDVRKIVLPRKTTDGCAGCSYLHTDEDGGQFCGSVEDACPRTGARF